MGRHRQSDPEVDAAFRRRDSALSPRWVHLDGQDGRFLEGEWLGQGSAGDIFTQAQFPIHSGRLLGLPGRMLIAVAGIATAMLSITGIVIWWKKRGGRSRRT